jgi:2'-5' RNA ligase
MRLFVALVPSPAAVEHLDAFLDVRRAAAPFRWARPAQCHLTLAFLADVEERRLDDLSERLGRAAA